MKLILAIIQPTKLRAVRDALTAIGVDRMTVCDAQGYGRQRGQSATYRGVEYKTNLLRKIDPNSHAEHIFSRIDASATDTQLRDIC